MSLVTTMTDMFKDATSFDQTLCGVSWISSTVVKAEKAEIFAGTVRKDRSVGTAQSCGVTIPTTTTTTTTGRDYECRSCLP